MSIGEVLRWKQSMLQHLPLRDGEWSHIKENLHLPENASKRQADIQRITIAFRKIFDEKHWIISSTRSFDLITPLQLRPLALAVREIQNYGARELLHAAFRSHVVSFSRWMCTAVKAVLEEDAEKLSLCKKPLSAQSFPTIEVWIQEVFKSVCRLKIGSENPVISAEDLLSASLDLILLMFETLASTQCSPYISLKKLEIIKDKLPEICEVLSHERGYNQGEYARIIAFLGLLTCFLKSDLSFPEKYNKESLVKIDCFFNMLSRALTFGKLELEDPLTQYHVMEILENIRSKNATEEYNYIRLGIPADIVENLLALCLLHTS